MKVIITHQDKLPTVNMEEMGKFSYLQMSWALFMYVATIFNSPCYNTG